MSMNNRWLQLEKTAFLPMIACRKTQLVPLQWTFQKAQRLRTEVWSKRWKQCFFLPTKLLFSSSRPARQQPWKMWRWKGRHRRVGEELCRIHGRLVCARGGRMLFHRRGLELWVVSRGWIGEKQEGCWRSLSSECSWLCLAELRRFGVELRWCWRLWCKQWLESQKGLSSLVRLQMPCRVATSSLCRHFELECGLCRGIWRSDQIIQFKSLNLHIYAVDETRKTIRGIYIYKSWNIQICMYDTYTFMFLCLTC